MKQEQNKIDYNGHPFRIFMSYFKPYKGLFLLDMSCVVAASAIDLIFPFVSKRSMETYLPQSLFTTFFIVMAILIAAYAGKAVLYYLITVVGHKVGILVEADMRRDLFGHMQDLSYTFYDKNRTGSLMSRVTNDLFDITELAHHGPENVLVCALTLTGAMTIMFLIQWKLALVLLITLPICIFFTMKQRVAMEDANKVLKETMAEINATIESGVSGVRTAKAFANEGVEAEKFKKDNDSFKKSKENYYKAMGRFQSGMEFSTGVMPVVVILAGGIFIMRGEMNYIDLVTFTLYVSTFTTPIRRFAAFVEMYLHGAAGFMRFLEIMRTKPDITDAPDAEELQNVRGEIRYENVSFCYNDGTDVLKDVTLTIAPGETIALVGPSGSGKTTMCHLLPRFYEVTSGAVKIDGSDIRKFTQHSLHKNIGIIQQDVFLFAGTIRENIRYGNPDATEEEIVLAAKRAEIHEEILEMPDGYDTYVGERGIKLSGGQKQRISIARVFLKNPPILILDEATSALDSVTEQRIQASLETLCRGRTSIIIAHRLSTIRNADRIAVIDGDGIAELGTHDRLMSLNGIYAGLQRPQSV